jgi:hypothetical protein
MQYLYCIVSRLPCFCLWSPLVIFLCGKQIWLFGNLLSTVEACLSFSLVWKKGGKWLGWYTETWMKIIFSHGTIYIWLWTTLCSTFHPSVIDSVPQIPVTEVLSVSAPARLLGHGISLICTHCSDCWLSYSSSCTGKRLELHHRVKVTVLLEVPALHIFQKQLCLHKTQDSGHAKQLVNQGVELHV